MKKIISVCLAMVLLISCVPVMAENDVSDLESIILTVKERIGDTEEYTNFYSNKQENRGNVVYTLNWSSDDVDYRELSVTITESGVITRYLKSSNSRYENTPKIRGISRKTALEKAQELLAKLNPDISDELLIKDQYTSTSLFENSFTFSVLRVKDGIPVPENSGTLILDGKAEEIIHFYMEYDDKADFQSKEKLINKDESKIAFTKEIGLEMEYESSYKDGKLIAYPVYKFKDTAQKISAVDGKAFVPQKNTDDFNRVMNSPMMDSLTAGKAESMSLSPAEIKNIENISGLISKEEGMKIISDNEFIPLSESAELTEFYVYKSSNYEDKYTAKFNYKDKENGSTTTVSMNLNSGEILSFYSSEVIEEDAKNALTEEEGKAYLEDAVKSLAGDKFAGYKENDVFSKNGINYTRYVNGIAFHRDFINANVNLRSGNITSYNINYTDIEFPSLSGTLNNNDACQKLFEQNKYDIIYVKDVKNEKTTFSIVYDFENSYINMDAYTGEIENLKINNEFNGYKDISGHYAEEIINILAEYGVRTEGEYFTPDEKITQADFIKLLGCIKGRYNEIYLKSSSENNFRWAYTEGIVEEDELSENEPVKRLKAAKLLVKTIGAEEFAKLDSIYVCPFEDVNEDIGYVSILYGMKVFKGDENGKFSPNAHITYAEAAVMLYNYLTR